MKSAIRGSTGTGGEAPVSAPCLSRAIRALQLMLKADCNVGDMSEPPYGRCHIEAHDEAREVIKAYKAAVLAQMRAG